MIKMMYFIIYYSKGSDKMSKPTLYKLFYSNPDKYETEYNNRFNDDDTIHIGIEIGKFNAFVCQSANIMNTIIAIERVDKKINDKCYHLPPIAVHQFAGRCLIDEIVKTNDIEGVHSTKREIGEVLENISVNNKKNRFDGIVKKYLTLMNDSEISIKSSYDIRKIYDDIFLDEIKTDDIDNSPDGEIFRKNNVGIQGNDGKIIHNGIAGENNIISAMEKSINFLNDDRYDVLLRLAIFHYLFGYIHPFYDGNGRTSRFISSYFLSKNLNRLIGYRISYTIRKNIQKYYKAFTVCNHYNSHGDLTPFAEMFLAIVLESEKDLLDALNTRSDKLDYYRNLIVFLPGSEIEETWRLYDLLIQAALFSNEGISINDLCGYIEVSPATLRKKIKQLPENLYEVNTSHKKKYYSMNLEEMSKFVKK